MTNTNLAKNFNAKSLTLFALPTMAMLLFECMYGVVDGLFVAKFVHIDAFSAIAILMPSLLFFMGIGTMFGVGGSAIVAKKMGEGKWQEAREDFSMIAITLAITSLVLFVICFIFTEELLSRFGATQTLMPYAETYFKIILIGMLFYMGQFLFQNFFIVAGEPKMGLFCVIGAGITNIVLDYVFIVPFGWGIAGAAWATTISCAIPNVIGLIFFFNRKHNLHFAKPRKNFRIIYQSGINGSASMVNMVGVSVIIFLWNQVMLSLLREVGIAAVTIVSSAEYIFNTIIFGYVVGILPIISFNYGAKNKDMLKKILKIAFVTIAFLSAVSLVLILLFAPFISKLYAENDLFLYEIALGGFYIFMFKYIFMGANVLMAMLFTALNNGKIATFLSVARTFGLVIPMLIVLPKYIGVNGVWAAVPAAEFITFGLTLFLFLKLKQRYF